MSCKSNQDIFGNDIFLNKKPPKNKCFAENIYLNIVIHRNTVVSETSKAQKN